MTEGGIGALTRVGTRGLVGIGLVLIVLVAAAAWLVAPSLGEDGEVAAEESTSEWHGDPVPEIRGSPVARVAVLGDSGTGGDDQLEIAQQLTMQNEAHPFDGLVILGDMIYPDGDSDLVDERILDPYSPLLEDGAELIPVLGNHDYGSDEQMHILDQLGRERSWYVERSGPLRVVVLDSERVEEQAQTEWLADALEGESRSLPEWTLVALHHPPYSAGYHGSSLDVRDAWAALFAAADVPLVLAGHDHDYQRSEPVDGVTYVVSGGGGAGIRPTGTADFTSVSTSTTHFLDLLVYDDRLVARAIDASGRLVDRFTLTR